MAFRRSSFGEVIHTRMERTDTYQGYPVPGGLVEHITIFPESATMDTSQRLRLASVNEYGKTWNTGKFPVRIGDVPTLDTE
jgi:hypothetical protein